MAAAILLRADYDANRLRQLAKHSDDADQTRRQLALAVICDGGSRGEAGELAGVGPQTVRDWVLRFNAEGPNGLLNRKAPGRVPLLSEVRRRELAEVIERGPNPAVDAVVRWRARCRSNRLICRCKATVCRGSPVAAPCTIAIPPPIARNIPKCGISCGTITRSTSASAKTRSSSGTEIRTSYPFAPCNTASSTSRRVNLRIQPVHRRPQIAIQNYQRPATNHPNLGPIHHPKLASLRHRRRIHPIRDLRRRHSAPSPVSGLTGAKG
jgi:transposase